MPFTKLEQSIFASFPSDSKFLSNENQKQLIATMFLCQYCCKITTHFKYHNTSSTCVGYMNFYCEQCLYTWVVCSQCTYMNQPKSSSLRDQKRSKHKVTTSLSRIMCDHTKKVHHHTMNALSNEPEIIFPNPDMFIEVDDNDDYEMNSLNEALSFTSNNEASVQSSNTNEYNANNELKLQLYRVFPDGPDNNDTKFNRHVREIIFQLNCNNSYSDYLIKKTWLRGYSYEDYKITISDTDLFLRIIRQLLMNSRDEQGNIVDIYRRIEKRQEDLIQQLRKRIFHLESTIEKYEDTFKLIDKEYLRETMIEPIVTTEQNSETDFDDMKPINLLPLPHTIQDSRYLMEKDSSFVSGLLSPPIHVNQSDGYAYILPSRLLPLFVSSGLEFEHVTDETDLSTLDVRSKYHSPDILSTLLKFQSTNCENANQDNNGLNEPENKDNNVYYIGLGLWSDGCDVGGASKAMRSLVKLITIHVIHPSLTENHVFPVGFGSDKGNHEYVRSQILNNLYDLQLRKKLVYVPSLNFFLAFLIQDRVEHCDFPGFSSNKVIE